MRLILFLQVLCSFDLLRLCHDLGTSSSIGGLDAKGKADRFIRVFEVLSLVFNLPLYFPCVGR